MKLTWLKFKLWWIESDIRAIQEEMAAMRREKDEAIALRWRLVNQIHDLRHGAPLKG